MTNFYVRYKNLNKGLTSAKYKYEMYYQIGSESYISTPLTSNTNTSDTYGKFTFSSNLDHAGKLITFYIKITDTVTGSSSSTNTFSIRSLKPPTIDSITASIKNLQNETVSFTINYKSNMEASVGDMTLLLNFRYKGVIGRTNNYSYTLTITDQAAAFPSKTVGGYYYSCIANNGNIAGFYNELLQDIYPSTGAGIYNPDLQLWVKIQYKDYPDCFIETVKSFDNWPNYMQENPIFDDSFSLSNQKDFYNPLDTLTLTRGNLLLTKTRTDGTALVTAKPQEIRYILKYQNQNKDFTNQQINLTTPKAVQDDNISIGFVSEVVYKNRKGETITKQYSNNGTSMEYIYINLAKWNENIVPFLSNCSQSNGKIEGKINFESDKVYSKKYYNLKSIKYEVYQKDQATAKATKTITVNSLTVPTNESFSFSYTEETSVDIYAKITYTNTSSRTFTVQTLNYIVRTENLVPLALRKKGIALNVEPTFDLTSRGSSIFAAAASDDVAILELQANSETTNPKFLHFLNGDSSIDNIYYDESDSLLHCDKWYYPPILGKNYNYQEKKYDLGLNDLKDLGVLTNGNIGENSGITLKNEKLINTGVLRISTSNSRKITVTDINGQKDLTISGFVESSDGYIFSSFTVQGFTNEKSDSYGPYHATLYFSTKFNDGNKITEVKQDVITALYKGEITEQDILFKSKTNMVIGTGESADKIYKNETLSNKTTKTFCLTSDSNIKFYSNCNLDAPFIYTMENGILTTNELKTTTIETEEINTNLINGKAIRYSENTPTDNLVVGQIWLKPKN